MTRISLSRSDGGGSWKHWLPPCVVMSQSTFIQPGYRGVLLPTSKSWWVLRVDEEGAVLMQRSSASTRQDAPPRGLPPSTCIQHASPSCPAPDDFANPRHQDAVSPAAFHPIPYVGRLHMPRPGLPMTGKLVKPHPLWSATLRAGTRGGSDGTTPKFSVVDQLGMADQR